MVELSISVWTGRKMDKKASNDITSQNGAARNTANVSKKLLANSQELTAIQKIAGNIRNTHYAMTMPWSDTGLRLLPTAQYFDYHNVLTQLEAEFNKLVERFLQEYEWEIAEAQVNLGALFHRDEYPTLTSLRDKFAFKLTYIPLPTSGDFRLDIGNEAQDTIKQHYESYYTAQLNSAMDDVWRRTYDALSRMSERLDYTEKEVQVVDAKGKARTKVEGRKVFRDTLVENVRDMIGLLDTCNVTGNSQMAAMKAQLEETMYAVTPDALRSNSQLRKDTKKAVDSALRNLPTLDW